MPTPPDPGPGEALVKVRAVGICGSDLHWYAEGRIGRSVARYPQVLGHEPAGEVVAADRASGFAPGDRVAIEPATSCGACEFCLAGRHNLCIRATFMGSPQVPGLLLEYALVPAANLVRVPDTLDWTAATLIEPLAVVLHILEVAPVKLGDTVAVLGAGPIGLLLTTAVRAAGAAQVFAAEKQPHRLALARVMGATSTVDARTASPAAAILDHTRGRGADIVFEASGDGASVNHALQAARPGGIVVLIGLSDQPEMALDVDTAMSKELQVRTIRRSNHNAHAAIEMLAAGRIPSALVTHHFNLDESPAAFELLATRTDGAGKIIIEIP